ncbi:hypothetical protein [Gordonia sp. OPL2]|jgi:hypothetical protein|uniref:hypothetical protein n=1 Tax=Gordonia sp. OPL2 TaxID=2486274 RepID=UPI00165583CF|nr:hypothetical protein [Gordonia sp. OPL2]RPA10291.1 hypothetical protein EEB19_08810 [Gordonia sp. OPL2]
MTTPDKSPGSTDELRQSVLHGAVTIGFALAALIVAWASDDGLRTTLIVAAPIIMLIGALAALWRTYRCWRSGGRWQIWQGASWFMLAMFIVFLFGTGPALLT